MTKANLVCIALAVCFTIGCASTSPDQAKSVVDSKSLLRHVVLFQFTADTTPEQVKEIEDAFRALPTKIPVVADFEWGTNVSPEQKNQGYTHCFFLTFRSAADRDAYLPHPAHKAFVALLKGHIEKVLVLDYWVRG